MKKIIFSCVFTLFAMSIQAQDASNEAIVNNSVNTLTRALNANQGGFGSVRVFVNPPREIEGSIYMFSDWSNTAIVQTKDKKRVAVENVNFNLRRNRIASKYGRDSLFVFDLGLLDKIIINGKTFKKVDPESDGRIFEVLFESEKADLLNFHYLKIVEGSANPMVNRKVDKFKHTENYYLYINKEFIPLKLKKRDILDVLSKDDETLKKKISQYYKKNDLSYRSIEDLKKVLLSEIFN